jgi:glycosyltransferase involved in cell wall biosynthesis
VSADRRGETLDGRRVLVIAQLDGFANQLKPVAIERFLRARGHDVKVVDTYSLARASARRGSFWSRMPGWGARRMALYGVEAARALVRRRESTRRRLSYPLVLAELALRQSILRRTLGLDDFDLVICETPHDAEVLLGPTTARTLYDCPTPWADELLYEGRLTERQHARLRRREADLFERVDFLAFHWESYARYTLARYGISGHNLITLNFGCTPSSRRASFANPPRGVYLGKLGGRFPNLPLLSRLTRINADIDVYGAPPPDPRLGLNYRGYASPEVLDGYQFGVITSTRDELRRDGFSAKHLEYFAHGLPALVPAWRRNLDLLRGSVPYEEATFAQRVAELANEVTWQRLSDQAYAQAERLSWDRTLAPLEALLADEPIAYMVRVRK